MPGVLSRGGNAFAALRGIELIRGIFVLRLCCVPWLVRNAESGLRRCESVFGATLTYNTLLKWTMFDHFCAHPSDDGIEPVLRRLQALGIGPILDYAAEADVVQPAAAAAKGAPRDARDELKAIDMQRVLVAPMSELEYGTPPGEMDANARRLITCVRHAAQWPTRSGISFSAMKLTALFDVQLLARITALLLAAHQAWVALCPGERRSMSPAEFARGAAALRPELAAQELQELAASLAQQDAIDYLDFMQQAADAILAVVPPTAGALATLRKLTPVLHAEEREAFDAAMRRVRSVVRAAEEKGVRAMVDAEQTFYQPAIDQIVRDLQREFNRETPRVYNTYQCYTRSAEARLADDMQRARREGWHWGGKVVRGAYMVQERDVAARLGYASPIHATKAETDACYDRCAMRILDGIAAPAQRGSRIGVLFGSHNVGSVQRIVDRAKSLPPHQCDVSVAQLYGMGNHISLPLAAQGFNVFKYVPYGPVKETTAYLLRRAVENSTMLSTPTSELGMMEEELRRRVAVAVLVASAAVFCIFCTLQLRPLAPRRLG